MRIPKPHWSKKKAYARRRARIKRQRTGVFRGGKTWERNRILARRMCCAICKDLYRPKGQAVQAIHHIFARRWVSKDEHNIVNLISVCAGCHAMVRRAETKLIVQGNALEWWRLLKEARWTAELILPAARHYKLNEVIKLLER